MAEPIFALRVNHDGGGHTYWAFGIASEFELALWHLEKFGVKFHAYHAVGDKGEAVEVNHAIPGDKWVDLSGGLNDHQELLNCLDERGELV